MSTASLKKDQGIFREELEIEPMEETRELFERIRDDSVLVVLDASNVAEDGRETPAGRMEDTFP